MKERIFRELIFFFFALALAIPIALLFLNLATQDVSLAQLTPHEQVLEMDLLLIGILLGFLGTYLARLAVWAVQNLIDFT